MLPYLRVSRSTVSLNWCPGILRDFLFRYRGIAFVSIFVGFLPSDPLHLGCPAERATVMSCASRQATARRYDSRSSANQNIPQYRPHGQGKNRAVGAAMRRTAALPATTVPPVLRCVIISCLGFMNRLGGGSLEASWLFFELKAGDWKICRGRSGKANACLVQWGQRWQESLAFGR